MIDWVQDVGGAPETGHRLVFLSVILFLAVTAAVYSRQPDRPAQ